MGTILAFIVSSPTPALADQYRDKQWHLRALDVAHANQITKGEGIIVAVLDTGVSRHVDLYRNLLSGTSVVPSTQANGQGDPIGHGTAMASLIAAHGRSNSAGVVGIAPSSKI